jgi:hypothetical protein
LHNRAQTSSRCQEQAAAFIVGSLNDGMKVRVHAKVSVCVRRLVAPSGAVEGSTALAANVLLQTW